MPADQAATWAADAVTRLAGEHAMLRSFVFHKDSGTLETDTVPGDWPDLLKDEDVVMWLDCEEVSPDEVARLSSTFRLHPLEISSLTRSGKRPRMYDYDDHLFLVLHSPNLQRRERRIVAPEVDIALGPNWLITCRDEEVKSVTVLADRVEKSPGETMAKGSVDLLYALIAELVENYQPVLDQFDALLAGLEERVLRNPKPALLDELSGVKRQLLALRRTAIPQAETILLLSRPEAPIIDPSMHVYFRDLYDRLCRVGEVVEMFRDLISGARDTYLSVVSNRMNEIMQTLTIVATIFIPLTFIAGLYGMNFQPPNPDRPFTWNMPELYWPYAYPAVMVLMAAIAVLMLFYFKRKKWL